MLPERIRMGCGVPERWRLDPLIWRMLLRMDAWASTEFEKAGPFGIPYPGLFIISGYRNRELNDLVGGAPDSRHLQCPSTAADLRFGSVATGLDQAIWAWFGAKWKLLGGRWGGDFGDENHFDLG